MSKSIELNAKSNGSPQIDITIKALCGDKSDNIRGCFKRCGVKTALKYYNNPKLLEEKFKKLPESKQIYELNRLLVDLDRIPVNLTNNLKKILIKNFS